MAIPISPELQPNIESVYSRTLERKLEDSAQLQFRVGQTFRLGDYAVQIKEDIIAISSYDKDQAKFDDLVEGWYMERGATSSTTEIVLCPSYQKIIAMGPKAIPLIFRQLKKEGDDPDMWFWALELLTNADPVTDDMKGDYAIMAQAWLDWWRPQDEW